MYNFGSFTSTTNIETNNTSILEAISTNNFKKVKNVINRNNANNIISINNINIGLPSTPSDVYKRSQKKEDQYWEVYEYPKQ